jgi:hypothetical protein
MLQVLVEDHVDPMLPARAWFAAQGWAPFTFQEEVWGQALDARVARMVEALERDATRSG